MMEHGLSALNVAVAVLWIGAAVTAIAIVAVQLARRLGDDTLDRALLAALFVVAQLSGVPLLLGVVGLLSRWPVLAVHVTFATLVLLYDRAHPLPKRGKDVRRGRPSPAGIAAGLIGALLATLAIVPTLNGRLSNHPESRNYHIGNLASWLGHHHIWSLPYQEPGFFTATHPGNGELAASWLVLPTHGDQLAYLVTIAFATLVVLAAAALTRELGGQPGFGALAAISVIAAPVSWSTQANSIATDLPAVAGLMAGIVFVLRGRRDGRARWPVLAGVALGLGVGSKYTVFIPVVVVLVVALVVFKPWRRAANMVPGVLGFAGPWFLRNAIQTGNPIFPQQIVIAGQTILPGGDSPLQRLSTTMLSHIVQRHTTVLDKWLHLVRSIIGPSGLLILAGGAAALIVAVRSQGERRQQAAIGAALVAVAAGTYFVTPYTGAGPTGLLFLMASNLRYALAGLIAGAVVTAVFAPRWLAWGLIAVTLAYDAIKLVQGSSLRPDLALPVRVVGPCLATVVALGALLGLLARRPSLLRAIPRAALVGAGSALVVIVATVLIVRRDGHTRATNLERAIGRVVPAGDHEPIVVLGAQDLRSILGSDLDINVVTLTAGGRSGELPYDNAAALSNAVDGSSSRVLVVAPQPAVLPPGFAPSNAWCPTAKGTNGANGATVYVRCSGEPPPAAPPTTPPTTLPGSSPTTAR